MWRLHADAHAVNNTYVYSKFNVVTATIFFLRKLKLNNYIYRKKLFKMSNSTIYFLFININKYIFLTNTYVSNEF